MGNPQLVYHTSKKPNSDLSNWTVSIKESTDAGLADIPSPAEMVGVGNCYGHALETLAPQLDDYIAKLVKFRDEVFNTTKAYTTAIEVDCWGQEKPIKSIGKE